MKTAKIFEDPIEKTKLEGTAKLIRIVKHLHRDRDRWQVQFPGDGFNV